jgi:hypothetical protein
MSGTVPNLNFFVYAICNIFWASKALLWFMGISSRREINRWDRVGAVEKRDTLSKSFTLNLWQIPRVTCSRSGFLLGRIKWTWEEAWQRIQHHTHLSKLFFWTAQKLEVVDLPRNRYFGFRKYRFQRSWVWGYFSEDSTRNNSVASRRRLKQLIAVIRVYFRKGQEESQATAWMDVQR